VGVGKTGLSAVTHDEAERTGFEPVEEVYPPHRFSKPALSAAQPPLQVYFSKKVTSNWLGSFKPLVTSLVTDIQAIDAIKAS
jgi:hypothetical protein